MNLRKILVIRNDRMGDLLMSLPAVQTLRCGFPKARIHLLLRREMIPLLEGHPSLDRLHGFEPGTDRGVPHLLRTAGWLRRESFDAVVVMNPSKFFHTASFLAGIPLRTGYRRKWGFLLNRSLPDTKDKRDLHETEYNLELVRLLGVPGNGEPFSIPPRPEAVKRVEDLLRQSKAADDAAPVAVHPWTSNPAKNLPTDLFWKATRRLISENLPVLVIGQPPAGEGVLVPTGAINLAGRTPLEILPDLLRRCRVLLSNDSGPVHVAAAVGTPTVVVAPQEHARQLRRWRPLGPRHRVLIAPRLEEVLQAVRGPCGS